jgi:hypothetical protein
MHGTMQSTCMAKAYGFQQDPIGAVTLFHHHRRKNWRCCRKDRRVNPPAGPIP